MTHTINSPPPLAIQENSCCQIGDVRIEIVARLAQCDDVHYYKVIVEPTTNPSERWGLLRIGSTQGRLEQERQLRASVGEHGMVSPLLACLTVDSVQIGEVPATSEVNEPVEENSDYLSEEFYAEPEIEDPRKLLLLTELPHPEATLETWLEQKPSLEAALLVASQICQFFHYLYQHDRCMISLNPQYIKMSTPLQWCDLTGIHPVGDSLSFVSDYCAPELAYDLHPVAESMSTYLVGMILYQAIHQKRPFHFRETADLSEIVELEIKKIPKISQILKIALSIVPEDRFPLSDLLQLLIKTRQSLQNPTVKWETASGSTIGLSTGRLQNEDSYGLGYLSPSPSEPSILAAVADGMGGMSQGDVASQLAVKTVFEAALPQDLTTPEKCAKCLVTLMEKANLAVTRRVRQGGTTLSLVLAVERDLYIAHVGDSRIYLLRKGQICQLSEDHSRVATLVASGLLTPEESLEHPDRSYLLKSLGDKPLLARGYVQDLSRFGEELSLLLEDGDIIILCSDGVWDVIAPSELADLFGGVSDLQTAVDRTLESVIEQEGDDNATLLCLRCRLETPRL